MQNILNDDNFPSLILELRRKINKDIKESSLKNKLSISQVEILGLVVLYKKRKMEDISDYLNIKPPSATILIDKMEKEGLIKRDKDLEDRRVINIIPTKKAEKLFKDLKKQKEIIFNKMISKLSHKDKKNLERIIKIIIK